MSKTLNLISENAIEMSADNFKKDESNTNMCCGKILEVAKSHYFKTDCTPKK